jgi:hypothetical protein
MIKGVGLRGKLGRGVGASTVQDEAVELQHGTRGTSSHTSKATTSSKDLTDLESHSLIFMPCTIL